MTGPNSHASTGSSTSGESVSARLNPCDKYTSFWTCMCVIRPPLCIVRLINSFPIARLEYGMALLQPFMWDHGIDKVKRFRSRDSPIQRTPWSLPIRPARDMIENDGQSLCGDKNAMEWAGAWMGHKKPPGNLRPGMSPSGSL